MLGEIASADYDTYSGYVADQNGRIPQENEVFTTARFIVTAKTTDGNSIGTYLFAMKCSRCSKPIEKSAMTAIDNILSGYHSGFEVYCGPTIWVDNDQGYEDLAYYNPGLI